MEGMLLHKGAFDVQKEELCDFELPQATRSYGVVPHAALVENIEMVLDKHNLPIVSSRFAVQHVTREKKEIKGARMFGLITTDIADGEGGDSISLSFGFRNSYDKSMSVGMAAGGKVFVCDNLMITGEVQVLRKHTVNVRRDINPMIEAITIMSRKQHELDVEMKERMKCLEISKEPGMDLLGAMAAHGFLSYAGGSGSMFALALEEWDNPSHEEFSDRNIWSLYNACTAANRKNSVANVMVENAKVTSFIRDMFLHDLTERAKGISNDMVKIRANFRAA